MTNDERKLMAWLIVVIALAIFMSGCATTPPVAPKILTEVKTVEVKVPVRVACLKTEDIPARPTRILRADADIRGLAAGAVAELRGWEAYYAKADAVMKGCL